MENLLVKMYEEPELVEALHEDIVDYYFGVSERIFDAAADLIDIFFIGNDFGGMNGPLMSEATFRRFFAPHLKRLVELGHDYGLKVMMHCYGGFAPLIPTMIEIGLDGLQALQPSAGGMEPSELKAAFGDRILMNGCIDTKFVLEGTPDLVRSRTREVLEVMMPGGGYVASPSHDYVLPETPIENTIELYETVHEIVDLVTNGWPAAFADSAVEHGADIVGISALLTTTMMGMKDAVSAMRAAAPAAKVMVGGVPVTDEFAAEIRADGFAKDAATAATVAQELLA